MSGTRSRRRLHRDCTALRAAIGRGAEVVAAGAAQTVAEAIGTNPFALQPPPCQWKCGCRHGQEPKRQRDMPVMQAANQIRDPEPTPFMVVTFSGGRVGEGIRVGVNAQRQAPMGVWLW